jgi:hypothetical protein
MYTITLLVFPHEDDYPIWNSEYEGLKEDFEKVLQEAERLKEKRTTVEASLRYYRLWLVQAHAFIAKWGVDGVTRDLEGSIEHAEDVLNVPSPTEFWPF